MTLDEFAEQLKNDIDEFVKSREKGVKVNEDALETFRENLANLISAKEG